MKWEGFKVYNVTILGQKKKSESSSAIKPMTSAEHRAGPDRATRFHEGQMPFVCVHK